MSGKRDGPGANDRAADSWANETLPLSLRKELLERDLTKLGLRRHAPESAASHGAMQQQQQPQKPQNEHPQADGEPGSHSE